MPTATPSPDRQKPPGSRSKRSTLRRATEVWWVQLLLRSVRRGPSDAARRELDPIGAPRSGNPG